MNETVMTAKLKNMEEEGGGGTLCDSFILLGHVAHSCISPSVSSLSPVCHHNKG